MEPHVPPATKLETLKVSVDTPKWDSAFGEELKELERRGFTESKENLVGLAFSGGGIRSATFGLGVLEGLKRLNLLKGIHYLSTVSGGGYVGAWLSANCQRAAEAGSNWLQGPPDKDARAKSNDDWIREPRSYSTIGPCSSGP